MTSSRKSRARGRATEQKKRAREQKERKGARGNQTDDQPTGEMEDDEIKRDRALYGAGKFSTGRSGNQCHV